MVPDNGLENNVLEMVDRNLLRYAQACQSHADHVIDNLPLYVNRMLDMARSGKQPEIAVSFAGLLAPPAGRRLEFAGWGIASAGSGRFWLVVLVLPF